MLTYHYDERTKEYTHSEEAFSDPLESKKQGKNVYLLPANAAFAEPTLKDGYANIWNGEAWEHIEDHRGKTYWLDTDSFGTPAREMQALGALPENAVFTAPTRSLGERKARAVQLAQLAFAAKRDSIRWVGEYGFDCAPEDITNFMAAYTPLLVAGKGCTSYKVWLTETTKGIVTLALDEMTAVYQSVRASQLEAYAWYEQLRTAIDSAETAEALDGLLAAEGITETTP